MRVHGPEKRTEGAAVNTNEWAEKGNAVRAGAMEKFYTGG